MRPAAQIIAEIDLDRARFGHRPKAGQRARLAGSIEVRRQQLAAQPGRRPFTSAPLTTRAGSGSTAGLVEVQGTVIKYGIPYQVVDPYGSFTETIHFGACTALLKSPSLDVRFLYGHDSQTLMPLARTGAKTALTLTDSPQGLGVHALIDPRQTAASDLIVALGNGTVTQMSVGMQVDPAGDVWSGEDDYGMPNQRDIYRLANIFDASAVAFPASPTTEITLASELEDELNPDGSTVSGPGNAPGIGNQDGSGSRTRLIDIDSDLALLRRRPQIR